MLKNVYEYDDDELDAKQQQHHDHGFDSVEQKHQYQDGEDMVYEFGQYDQ